MDLHEFLKQREFLDPFSFSNEVTFYHALQGLASALDCIHNFSLNKTDHLVAFERIGSHRDIRPQNILVDLDTFLFADFGLSDFKDRFDDRGSQTLWKAGRGDYIAPECYGAAFNRQKVGRAVDIWAFGCLIIDIATYMKTGTDGLGKFKSKRNGPWRPPFENGYFFHEESIKPEVLQHLAELQEQRDDAAYHKLLKMAKSMLTIQPDRRMKSQQVLRILNYICTVAQVDSVKLSLTDYDNFLTSQAEMGPSQVTLWFEMERLDSWATILDLYEDEMLPRNFVDASLDPKAIQSLLSELKVLVASQHRRMLRTMSLRTDMEHSWILHSQFRKDLAELVQGLFDCLPLKLQKRADILWTQRLLDTNEVERLGTYISETRLSDHEPYQRMGNRALIKKNLVTLSEPLEPNFTLDQFYLDPAKLTDIHTIGMHDYGYYSREDGMIRVLIEPAFLATERAAGNDMSSEELTIRKLALARLFSTPDKPASFCVLDCVGFIDRAMKPHTGRVDYIFRLPNFFQHQSTADAAFKGDPQSLLQVLEDLSSKEFGVPPLEQRVSLAQALVTSIHSLHLNGWLHKSLNASNVLLFPNFSGALDLIQPRIIGFSESRPDGDIWNSSGPEVHSFLNDYTHPEYRHRRVRFRRIYDYFSLGILLLEVGLWRSLRSISSKYRSTPGDSLWEVLLAKYMPRLRPLMGSVYANAVEKCLQSDFKADTPGSGAEVQVNEFYVCVVEPIVDIHI